LKSDDSYRVAFEEQRFISSRIWRTTIHIESCLKSDDSISSRIVSESHLGNSRFVRLSFRSYFCADICWGVSKSLSIACLKALIDSFLIILRWNDLLTRRRDHLSWDTSNYLSRDASDHFLFARCERSIVARCEQSWLGWCERSCLGWCEWSGLVCAQLQEWPKMIFIFGEGGTDDCYSARPCSCVPRDTLCFPVSKSCWCCPLIVDWAKRDSARSKTVSWLRLQVKRV
jgi:hypothetical protein